MKLVMAMVLLSACAVDEVGTPPGPADQRTPAETGVSELGEVSGRPPPSWGGAHGCDPDTQVCADVPLDSGYTWSVQAQIASGNYYTLMGATFTVPAAPHATFTQSPQEYVAFWPGLGDSPGLSILQPVLYYGYGPQGGGNHWYLQCFYADQTNSAHSNVVAVNPGDSISASMQGTNCNANGRCTWTCIATDNTSHVSTSGFPAYTAAYAFDEAYGGVNENDQIPSCLYFPTTDATTFASIALYDKTGAHIASPPWIHKFWPTADPTDDPHGNDVPCSFGASNTTTTATLTYAGWLCLPGSQQECCPFSRCTCDGEQACNAGGTAWGACRGATQYPYSCP
ncbi:MAG TPA: hypothetical protein VGM88_32010 [Kofleriaceae bacterium]|jgi:hypothetical protein